MGGGPKHCEDDFQADRLDGSSPSMNRTDEDDVLDETAPTRLVVLLLSVLLRLLLLEVELETIVVLRLLLYCFAELLL